jgi:DnaJ-domain-containing protein 1
MSSQTEFTVIVVVLSSFFGYSLVSVSINAYRKRFGNRQSGAIPPYGAKPPHADGAADCPAATNPEERYRQVLGVSAVAGEAEIKAAYKHLLAKYHPDKVFHLGEEFYDLASARTMEIIEAYQFLSGRASHWRR